MGKKLLRTLKLYKAQFISMIIMVALGVGVFVGFNMEWVSIEKNTEKFFQDTGFADYRIVSDSGFSADELEEIRAIGGVDGAARYVSVNADVAGGGGDSLALTVTEDGSVSGFVLIEGAQYDPTSTDGIWLSDKYAAANGISVGDGLTLEYSGMSLTGKVAGLVKSGEHMICVRDETQLMPDFNTYGFAYISPKMYEDALGFEFYPQINVISHMEKGEFTDKVEGCLEKTLLILTKDETISYAEAQGESEEGKSMGAVLPVIFLVIAVLTMVTTMHRIAAKEKTQIGTLKALGFTDRRILRHYTSYAFVTGIIGCAIGVALGYLIAWYIMNPNGAMGTYLDMPEWKLYLPWFCYVVVAAVIGLLTLIGFLSVKQMLRGTAADALRPYTPKKMKNMFIERFGFFDKLSFGAKWNLRDIMRHKSRSAMSLLGVIGCMIIIVAALGMSDTMDAFLANYYDDATKYASRIYLADDAGDEQRERILEEYDGDWSASVSVQLDDAAVSLDIYDTEHGFVSFPENGKGFMKLGDSGAYICRRIADENSLKVGDSFTVSPYGSSESYELKVAGVIRSVSKNIVITPAYAETLGISYRIDSVYTLTDKADIVQDSAIKSVQSKQMIVDSFDTFTELMDMMVVILILGAALLGVVVLYNLGVMSYTERYREMATLKVVGFMDRRISGLLIGQNMWITALGVIIGLPAGIGVLNYMINELASEYEMRLACGPKTYILSVVLTFGVSLLVSLLVSRKNKHIDMVEPFKEAE